WGKTPSNAHVPASVIIGTNIRAGISLRFGAEALAVRRFPQNTLYPARTITTVVRTLVRMAMTAAHHNPAWARARYIVSLLQNPLRGGKPARANAPRKKHALVIGIRLASPPSSDIRLAPVAYITAPTHMNN